MWVKMGKSNSNKSVADEAAKEGAYLEILKPQNGPVADSIYKQTVVSNIYNDSNDIANFIKWKAKKFQAFLTNVIEDSFNFCLCFLYF